jgi:hypothetical protein
MPIIGTFLRREADKNGEGWQVPPPRGGSFGITQEPDLSLVRSHVTPQPLKTFLQPLHLSHPDAIAAIPHTYIECTRRGAVVWLMRRIFLGGSLPRTDQAWNRRKLASDHIVMILEPQAVADLLLEIA